MFFASPVSAFANLLSALRPGGRLTFLSWQALDQNPWMQLPILAAAKHLPPGGPIPDPTAPGPFAFANRDRVGELLRKSGFVDVRHESLERDLLIGGGGSREDAIQFLMQMGPAAAALRTASADLRERVIGEIETVIQRYATPEGIRMPSATWIVTATRAS